MWQRLLTLSTWALVGASAVGYGLRLWPGSAPSQAPLAVAGPADASLPAPLWQRLLGAAPAAEAALPSDPRYTLVGVAAPRAGDQQRLQGVALLSVDGGPARAVRVGQWVDGQTQLLAVSARGAELGRDGVARLHLPLQGVPEAATGSLPAPVALAPAPVAPAGIAMPPMNHLPATPLQGVAMPPMPPMPGPAVGEDAAREGDAAGPRRVRSDTAR